jgi:hypothetical protein
VTNCALQQRFIAPPIRPSYLRTNWRRHDGSDATVAAWFATANSAETRRSIPSNAKLTATPANCIEIGQLVSRGITDKLHSIKRRTGNPPYSIPPYCLPGVQLWWPLRGSWARIELRELTLHGPHRTRPCQAAHRLLDTPTHL